MQNYQREQQYTPVLALVLLFLPGDLQPELKPL